MPGVTAINHTPSDYFYRCCPLILVAEKAPLVALRVAVIGVYSGAGFIARPGFGDLVERPAHARFARADARRAINPAPENTPITATPSATSGGVCATRAKDSQSNPLIRPGETGRRNAVFHAAT